MAPDTLIQDAFGDKGLELWDQAYAIWVSGGWSMVAIAAVALVMFGMGMHVLFELSGRVLQFMFMPEKTWRHWIDHPAERRGPIGEVLTFVTGGATLRDTAAFFEELRSTEVAPFERDLRVIKVCVAAAPLLGLLGTVTGMLTTFSALAAGSGGEETMAEVAEGISEALVTTETGLVVALPGLIFQHLLARLHERNKAFIAHLETVCTQRMYRRLVGRGPDPAATPA